MDTWNRRKFVQLSTGALLTAANPNLLGIGQAPSISAPDGFVRVRGTNYSWEYSQADDKFSLRDSRNRLIVSGILQPAVVVAPTQNPSLRQCARGRATGHHVEPGRVTFEYEGVNGSARLSVPWRFDEHGIWSDPIVYQPTSSEEIVSLHYFSEVSGTKPIPSLHASYWVVPGISEGSAISPIVQDNVHLDESVWLGRGSFIPGLNQQWGLPVHYFCGFSVDPSNGMRNMFTDGRSDAFVCGLADLPGGDLFLQLYEGKSSLWIDYRSDLWKHLHGPGKLSLGATLFWSVAPDYYQAIGAYYNGLVQAGIIHRHQSSEQKTAITLTPEFCTWGSQLDRNKAGDHLDDAYLNGIYADLKASGMKAGTFSIDDKWEEAYGNLEHSTTRLPHFEQFLDNCVPTDTGSACGQRSCAVNGRRISV